MNYTKPEIDSVTKINPHEDIETIARRIEAAAQKQVAAARKAKQEIAQNKSVPMNYEQL